MAPPDSRAPAVRMPASPEPRELEFTGGPHPFGIGHCALCHEPAPQGVAVRTKGRSPLASDPYVFICVRCVRQIEQACP